MSEKNIIQTVEGKISTITLNNPTNHNAFDADLIKDFIEILESIENNDEIFLVILKAAGQNFSAGANLNWMKGLIGASEQDNQMDAMLLAKLLTQLNNLTKPVIASVQGKVLGGGNGLLACCDIVIAEPNAQFCFSEVKLGLIPATIAPYVVRNIGFSYAKRYFIAGDFMDANTAQQIGLIHVITESSLEETVAKWAARILKNGPHALTCVKQQLNSLVSIDATVMTETANLLAAVRTSDEAQEGIKAFLEKRPPKW